MTFRTWQNRIQRILWLTAGLLLWVPAGADVVELNPQHPERYTVVKGDTLWDIAGRFLQKPWRWPEIWKQNQQIENPHLIYPGDLLILSVVDGEPELRLLRSEKLRERTVKLSPAIYAKPLVEAIPTLPPSVIQPFLTEPLVLEKGELEQAGYITGGVDDKILLGKYSQFYARGIGKAKYYQIFRSGEVFIHPETQEVLGYEAMYLGEARLLVDGDPAKLEITRSKQEIRATDRLLPAPKQAPAPYYQPHAPENNVYGRIISAIESVSELGPATVVVLSLGKRDDMEEGHVMRILRHAGVRKDPVQGKPFGLPDEDTGLAMVFRTFDKVSYALVMTAKRPVHILDVVQSPRAPVRTGRQDSRSPGNPAIP